MKDLRNRRVLITGVCGTVGSELLRHVLDLGATDVIGLDNNEGALFTQEHEYRGREQVQFLLGDVRSRGGLAQLCEGVDTVFHLAAYKHVSICERSPLEAIETNVLGTSYVVDAAIAAGVRNLVFTSSDKAVHPVGVMAATKLLAERVLIARRQSAPHTILTSVRFGNVLGSSGSVVPLFASQIASGGPVTITDRSMTRFVMSATEAAGLIVDAATLGGPGDIFVPLPVAVRIEDLAAVMIEELADRHGHRPEDIPVEVIGPRAGEKLHEALMTESEALRTVAFDRCVAIKAEGSGGDAAARDQPPRGTAYRSDQAEVMPKEALAGYLRGHGVFSDNAG